MTDVITGTTSSSTSGLTTASNARSNYDEQYETFLTLLTTQLQNQNPLEPLDTNEFTNQVVQFSSLEQQITQNSQLEALVGIAGSFMSTSAMAFVGDTVTVDGAAAQLSNGSAEWTYDVSRTGESAVVTIRDLAGNVIRSDIGEHTKGTHTYRWNGRGDDGQQAPDGTYTISVDVRDNADTLVSVSTSVSGTVDEVDLTGPEPLLIVNGREVPMTAVQSVRASSS